MCQWYLKWSFVAFTALLVITTASCRKDFEYVPSTGNLEFSKDTVFLDTIFTNIGSSTYTLKVYNRSDEDIYIPYVGLQTGQNSSYRLNVDGLPGKEFDNVPLLAKDSLYIFIETTFDVSQTLENEFLYTESLLFGSGPMTQKVELVTLVRDAIFLYPKTRSDGTKESLVLGMDENGEEIKVEGFYLEADELLFTNEKPYVIYGYAAVPDGNTLIMQPGARVHFHKNSGILVDAGASLFINGELSEDQEALENEVVFEGDRLEQEYSDQPGQWGTIWIREGSSNNQINHLTLKNATVGLRVEGNQALNTPTLTIHNSQIYNSQNHNVWSTRAYIDAENTVLGSAGGSSFYGELGGKCSFTHCTLANYWNKGFRNGVALSIQNFAILPSGDRSTAPLEYADFVNSIIFGSASTELVLQQDLGSDFNFNFSNCLIKFNISDGSVDENPLYNFENSSFYRKIVFNQDPEFKNQTKNQLNIHENSAAIDLAAPDASLTVPTDILGNDRTQNPDIGAYEFVTDN
ncbi:choice-of-anchor Q domain-containing protein [Muricauda sp. MAR_2010_75]|uniref:choice-of-anchor Q domain-containing protein n=1 Tax=Allomuricauda sp. MAR_2010_75 TaxID=1250232 RepID=UPI00055B8C7B|nr:choice-of-anchor Q domain-containing protein [Muricauda sp. MAR_2010_75]